VDPASEADLAATYFQQLVKRGVPESVAAQLTCAWILGRLRAKESWQED